MAIFSGKAFFVSCLSRSADRDKHTFTGGAAAGSGIFSHQRVSLPKAESFGSSHKLSGFAKGSPFGRAVKAAGLD